MRICFIIGCFLFFATGCNQTSSVTVSQNKNRPIKVVTTTGMIADAVKNIGGEYVQVEALMGPGVDPHQYRASAGDLKRLQSADLVLYNGLHLEGKMADVLEQFGKDGRCVAVTKNLDKQKDLRPAPEGYDGAHDPHVWFDVQLWSKAVETMGAELKRVDPAHGNDYTQRTVKYVQQLSQLHNEVLEKARSVPAERRVLITAHDAFFYFGRAYGFEVHGLQGVSTVSEPGTKDVQELAKLIGSKRVPAIFGETSVPDRNLKAVVDAVEKGYSHQVKFIAGQLYSDALGDPKGPAGTYVGMVRTNIETMVNALR
jgi:manganese/zinc/iron transport system substrate-binding protein